MALISPGVQVTVSDESQYQPTAQGTIPLVLIATAQDKLNPQGSVASGTTAANAAKVVTLTSQRDLTSLFGTPNFVQDAAGNPIHAHELNEYGLFSAYSALGVSNRVLVQRANIDLAQLSGTSIRPTGTPSDGVYWLDESFSQIGVFEFDSTTTGFTKADVTIIDDTSLVTNGVPLASVGAGGSYAIVTTSTSNPLYYKRAYDNTWQRVGTDGWKLARPTIVGSVSNPTDLAIGQYFTLNGANIVLSGDTVNDVADDITTALGAYGVIATVNEVGQLEIRADSTASSTGNTSIQDGQVTIEVGDNDAAEILGLFSSAEITANVTSKTLNTPTVQFSDYRDVPAWGTTDNIPRPTGSVWLKTSATGNGTFFAIRQYSSTLSDWTLLSAPLYASESAAVYGLDPVGGGSQIAVGSLFVKYDILGDGTTTFKPYIKDVNGALRLTSDVPGAAFELTTGDSFVMSVTLPGSSDPSSATITVSDAGDGFGTAQSFVADILSANLPNITATANADGSITISHLAGGVIRFTYVSGTVLTDIGITADSHVSAVVSGSEYLASPFLGLTYTYGTSAPFSDPADGTLWYYSDPTMVDIMVHDGAGWKGYHNVDNDARGYDLTLTDPLGPIMAASRPTTQTDGGQLQPGDLWIDTGDLENFPVIYRFTSSNTWALIDNTDQISSDGVLFADARWSTNDSTDPIVDALPGQASLLQSNYLDPDAPDYRLYARGTLLFNTRRSGYNVKRFDSQLFADAAQDPTVISGWVSHSGVDTNGVPYFGHKAQRNTVVEAMAAAVESSVALREEQVQFNLIVAPGYPELIQSMITLNNDRKQTAFIIGDSPLTLNSQATNLTTWATNANLADDNGDNGLVSTSEYLGVFYPSGLTKDLTGNNVVVPASHMMLRTFIRSDNQSYQWFAPAGVRRGVIDNATSIGYVDVNDEYDFKSIGVTVGLRDVLYENRVNPLTVLPGVGLVAYGQKTRAAMTSAMDRINVARLVCYLRNVLDKIARPFIFEPNDTITRNQVKSAFEAVLNDIVAKRGIYDYLVVCDDTNNTPDRIDRNELYVDIAIEPVKAIEFIYIPVRIKNTGSIAAGV